MWVDRISFEGDAIETRGARCSSSCAAQRLCHDHRTCMSDETCVSPGERARSDYERGSPGTSFLDYELLPYRACAPIARRDAGTDSP